MICSSMTTYLESSTVQDYVKHVNDDLYPLLLHKQPIPDKAWLPSSPEPSSPERLVPIYKDPLPGTLPSRIGKFVYAPQKRLRGKTSDGGQASASKSSASAVSVLEACAEDAEADLNARESISDGVEEDFGADEEAAMLMNS